MVKYDDEKCCKPFRSDISNLLTNRFLPPPYPIVKGNERRVYLPPKIDHKLEFDPLLVRLSLFVHSENTGYKSLPYHYYCPGVQSSIKDRSSVGLTQVK